MLIVLDFVGVKLRYARYYRIIAEIGDYYIIIQILLFFFFKFDDLPPREVQYLPSQRQCKFCISRITKSSYCFIIWCSDKLMQTYQIKYDQVKTNYFEVIAEKFETRYIGLDGMNNENQSLRFEIPQLILIQCRKVKKCFIDIQGHEPSFTSKLMEISEW